MRQLKLKIKDKDYILEYNRESIKWLEKEGFDMDNFLKKPVTYIEMLWQSLFIKNYSNVISSSLANKLMDSYSEEKGEAMLMKVISFSIEEYKSFLDALAGTNSEKTEEELEIIEQ